MKSLITRRSFIRLLIVGAMGLWLSSCGFAVPIQPDSEQIPGAVESICSRGSTDPIDELGLCLSGGGYRAMLFHVGALWRLYETGLLAKCTRISIVSGGSITSGVLAFSWTQLGVDEPKQARFVELVVNPILKMASKTIDIPAGISRILLPGNINSKVEKYYRKYLYGDKDLQDLPDSPRFIILVTNLQSTALFRFSKPYLADYRVGVIPNPKVAIATAVAASSAFPPFLSPSILKFNKGQLLPCNNSDLNRPPFTTMIKLSDGGVYGNLGLEPLKRYTKVFISDAGGKTQPEKNPSNLWLGQSYRVLNLIDNQVRSFRKRTEIGDAHKKVAYWSTRTDIDKFIGTPHRTDLTREFRNELARIPTRLKALSKNIQQGLINWGYISCDTMVRIYYKKNLQLPHSIPYPESVTSETTKGDENR